VKSAPDKGAFQVQSVNLIFSPANGTSFTVNDILLGHNNNTTDQDYRPVLESPAGVTTTIASVRNLRYAVTTRGAGTFDMASTNSHHNTLVVQDGTTVFRAKRPELNPDFTKITVKDGAAFRLAEGKVSVTTLRPNRARRSSRTRARRSSFRV